MSGFSDLSLDEVKRLKAVAKAREERPEDLFSRLGHKGLRGCPRNFSKHIPALKSLSIRQAGIRDGLAYLSLPNGRVFFGFPSRPNHRRAYEYVKDIVPQGFSADTFLLGLDIAQRYATDFAWPIEAIRPGTGGTIIEVGAYLGHKTVRFAEELVGTAGKVLAIEMIPQNVAILRKNVAANGLDGVIDVVEAGIWSTPSQMRVRGMGRQRNSLVSLEKLDVEQDLDVNVDTLDNFITRWGVNRVDLVFLTVNGAEIEALHGFNSTVDRVRALFVEAPYERDGRPNADICRDLLCAKGFQLLPSSKRNRVLAVRSS